MTKRYAILAMLMMTTATSAMAQEVLKGDVVVMRRTVAEPQPRTTNPAPPTNPTTPTDPTSPVDPTPPVDPVPDPEPTPTPTPTPEAPGTWTVGEWTYSSTAAACTDAAPQTRMVECRVGNQPVLDSRCTDEKPDETQNAGRYDSCKTDWVIGGFGNYDDSCSSTSTRTQTVQCQRYGGTSAAVVLDPEECDANTKPDDSETVKRFTTCSNTWSYGEWGNYSSTCSANATRTRTATCSRSNPANPSLVLPEDVIAPNTECSANNQEPITQRNPIYTDCSGMLTNGRFSSGLMGWMTSGEVTLVDAGGGDFSAQMKSAGHSVSQHVVTEAIQYTVTYSCFATGGFPLRAYWNDVIMASCGAGGNSSWRTESFTLMGTGTVGTLRFASTAGGRRVDNVVFSVAQ